VRVAIVHNAVETDSAPDERDVLDQVQAVAAALASLGHSTVTVPCTLNLEGLQRRLQIERPDCVFNLVESLGGQGRLAHLAPALFSALGLPYSGSDATVLLWTNHKIWAKNRMRACGLPTPDWIGPWPAEPPAPQFWTLPGSGNGPARWIVKSVWEHASLGIEDDGIVAGGNSELLLEVLQRRAGSLGDSCFAEAFVEGREFNLALLADADGPQVLPPAEIVFENFPQSKPHIVDYRAKWDTEAFEYHHTPRRFEFPRADRNLLAELAATARRCWEVFGLDGYARVDLRVDEHGRPHVLEVNANPCLSPDAGYAASLAQAGIAYSQAVGRILDAASRHPACTRPFAGLYSAAAQH